jgi:hypothetical protein
VDQVEAIRAVRRSTSELQRRFEDFLKRHEPGLKGRVERTFKQWNNILRDYLRNETGLRLTVGDGTQAVPVRIDDGLPESFAEALSGLDDRDWSLLVNQHVLQQGLRATKFVQHGFDWISEWSGFEPTATEYEEFRHVGIFLYVLLRRLRTLNFTERIRAIQEDVLGAYFFRLPEVRLYWMVIAFLSGVLGVSVEALTVVVAAHELAHAYTHLGGDIGGERWETEGFAASNLAITEGLAQFYTKVICKKLGTRFPAALEAYERLLKLQSGPYLVHEDWANGVEAVGEVVRISMITCRLTGITKLGRFDVIRRQHAERLNKVRQRCTHKSGALEHRQKVLSGPRPTLSTAVEEAVLWTGNYYYAQGIREYSKWYEIIQSDIGREVAPYPEDAWSRITRPLAEKKQSSVTEAEHASAGPAAKLP